MRITVLCADLGIRVPGDKGASIHLQAITRALAGVGHSVQLVAVGSHEPPPAGLMAAVEDLVLLPHPGRCEGLARERQKLTFNAHLLEVVSDRVAQFRPQILYERLSLFGTSGLHLAAATGAIHVLEINALLAREDAAWRGLHLRVLADELEARVLRGADLRLAVSQEVATQVRSVAPDQRASFAEVAQAVDVATSKCPPDAASPFSEDFLPQRLPKRGRRGSRLETPWVRERPVESAPPAAVAAAAPAPEAAPAPAPLPTRGGPSEAHIATATVPTTNGASVPEPDASAAAPAGGGERFAFFAAFRAAAEQAREEAGIDDRRRH